MISAFSRAAFALDEPRFLEAAKRAAEFIEKKLTDNHRLKRAYRDRLRAHLGPFPIIYLDGDYELLRDRMSDREGHYMPVSLLDSQFEALEPPTPEEGAICVSVTPPPEQVLETALKKLSSRLQGGPDGSGQADHTPRRTS